MTNYYKINSSSTQFRGPGFDAARRFVSTPDQTPRSATLSRREIRGIVAEMLG